MALIATIVSTLLPLGLFAGLAASLSSRLMQDCDAVIRLSIHQLASPTFTRIAQAISFLGSAEFLGIAFVIGLAALLAAGWRHSAVLLAVAMAGAVILENALKYACHRLRPEPFFGTEPSTYSFPSGHALFSFCFYSVLANAMAGRIRSGALRALVWITAVLLIVAIGVSRIYLGVHYPTDVLGGYLIAAFWIGAVASIGRLRCRTTSERR